MLQNQSTSVALLTNVPDGQCGDGGPELVVRRECPVVAMPVLPRRWDQIGKPPEKPPPHLPQFLSGRARA